MKNTRIEDIAFNYYLNTQTYVKTALDYLPGVPAKEKELIIEMFNFILSSLNKDEIKDILQVSRMFNEKLAMSSSEDVMVQVKSIYMFLRKMLFESSSRYMYFNIMNEYVKVNADYYNQYQNDDAYTLNQSKVDNIYIRY